MGAPPLVLVVEDNPFLRRVLSQAIESEGCSVVSASDGLDALDALRGVRPAVVVLDLSMPRVNGWEFIQCYQHLTGVPLPLVVASAEMSSATTKRLRAMGVKFCLAKPFDLDEIIACVKHALLTPMSAERPMPGTVENNWTPHVRELTEMIIGRLDASHALLIRAEDAIGWSSIRIHDYYAEQGLLEDVDSTGLRG